MQLIHVLLIVFASRILAIYLSPRQMYSARGLLMNPSLTTAQRQSVQNLLYVSHEKWAIKKAIEFKQLHRYKCRDISTDELTLSSKIGLLKSSKKYNGRTPFVRFSEVYVKSELLRTLTIRISSKNRMRTTQAQNITRAVETINHLIPSEQTTPPNNSLQNEFYRSAWAYIDTLDAFTKRTIWLKYNYEFKTQYSNKYISEMMCCSEETVRKAIVRFSSGMRQEVLCSYTSV